MVGATALSLEGLVGVDADVVRLRRGDPNALSELITRYQNRLYRYLLRIVRQPAEAEDLFQQTWLRVVEKRIARIADSNWQRRRRELHKIPLWRRDAVRLRDLRSEIDWFRFLHLFGRWRIDT